MFWWDAGLTEVHVVGSVISVVVLPKQGVERFSASSHVNVTTNSLMDPRGSVWPPCAGQTAEGPFQAAQNAGARAWGAAHRQ